MPNFNGKGLDTVQTTTPFPLEEHTPGKIKESIIILYNLFCNRYDGGINADDVPINLPSQQLRDLATSYYKTKVLVRPNQRKLIELSTSQHDCADEM